jgi:2-polyprenyl-6-methoxyphenol hydroxylase-like FAD-dependent oxidoreductase
MTEQRAVVSGASIAGLSTAFWLRRTGWSVTVLERSAQFRDGGQNVDVRGVARDVVDRMGVLDAVRAANTTETATALVDEDGRDIAELPSDGPDGATAELEILRGDLARVVLDALPDGVEILFGETIETVDDDPADAVRIVTGSGRVLDADLLIIAEGVRSTTRDRLFPDEVDRRDMRIDMVFGAIPRTPDDDDRWRWLTVDGGRQVHLRPDPHGATSAILATARGEDLTELDRSAALALMRERYADVGWEAGRVLDGFDASDDVYIDRLMQIRMPRWHRGRVVLVGDAAWCVTPIGGGGASLALTGAYVLAASLSTGGDREDSLARYESWMRPLVDGIQRLPKGIEHFAYPETRLGVTLRNLFTKALVSSPLAGLTERLTSIVDTERELPHMVVPTPLP